jgi:hypothetical protein
MCFCKLIASSAGLQEHWHLTSVRSRSIQHGTAAIASASIMLALAKSVYPLHDITAIISALAMLRWLPHLSHQGGVIPFTRSSVPTSPKVAGAQNHSRQAIPNGIVS